MSESSQNTEYKAFILECLHKVPRASVDVMLRAYLCISWQKYLSELPNPTNLLRRDDFRDVAEQLVRDGKLKKERIADASFYSLAVSDKRAFGSN